MTTKADESDLSQRTEEDEMSNEDYLNARYGEEDDDSDLLEDDEEQDETESGEASEDTGVEDTEDEDETDEDEGESVDDSESGDADTPEVETEEPSEIEQMRQMLEEQQRVIAEMRAAQSPQEEVDPRLQQLFNDPLARQEQQQAQPAQQQQPAQPKPDPLQSALAEHMLTQSLPFFRDERELDGFNGGDVGSMNLILTRVVNTAVEQALRAAAKITVPMIAEQVDTKSMVVEFLRENPHYRPHRAEVGRLVASLQGMNPDKNLAEILNMAKPELDKLYAGKKGAGKQAAQPRQQRRGPAVRQRPTGSRYQGAPQEADQYSVDAWLAAKREGNI